DLAKRDIAKNRQVVVVEGYTDVMAMHLAGVGTAVATCGTAFGPDHIKIVRRLLGDTAGSGAGVMLSSGSAVGGEVIFTFDGDEAGQKAAMRPFDQDQSFVSQTFVAVAASGQDPCELRQSRGDDAVRDLVAQREPLFELAIRTALAPGDPDTAAGRGAGRQAASGGGRTESGCDGGARPGGQCSAPGGDGQENAAPVSANGPAPPGPRYSDDPAARLERPVLVVVLQLPQPALEAGFVDL